MLEVFAALGHHHQQTAPWSVVFGVPAKWDAS